MGARFSAPVPTGPGAHLASYAVGTGSFRGVKRPGHGVDHPPRSSAEVRERVELYLYSPSGSSLPVVGRTSPLSSIEYSLMWQGVISMLVTSLLTGCKDIRMPYGKLALLLTEWTGNFTVTAPRSLLATYLLALFRPHLAVRRALAIRASRWMNDRELSVIEETHSTALATESSYM